ncbi:hypothetical protein BN938_2902 [Mucinivorans hirudinis]|uniref:Uncharacterized protein n=1 Tax=Mucinivorans hirudinis TaxID=1433126 RepID=A0A060RBK5_9BACT|nr:hypothetical protein BN938_2902 [Mucinivorans hirudinis]
MKSLLILLFLLLYSYVVAQEIGIERVEVIGKMNPAKIMYSAAKNFGKQFAKEQVTRAFQWRLIEQNGKIQQFSSAEVLLAQLDFNQKSNVIHFENSANFLYSAPLSTFRSYAFDNGRRINFIDSNTKPLYGLTAPTNCFAFIRKRAIETHSPLNAAMVKHYNVKVERVFRDKADSQIIMMSFATRPQSFPSKVRLLCNGTVTYNATEKYVVAVDVEQMVDYFSTKIHSNNFYGEVVTNTSLKVGYRKVGNRLFTDYIRSKTSWSTEDSMGYRSELEPRAEPAKTKLIDREYIVMSKVKECSKNEVELIKKSLFCSMMGTDLGLLYAPADNALFLKFESTEVTRHKIEKDLTLIGVSLSSQAQEMAFTRYDVDYETGKLLVPINEGQLKRQNELIPKLFVDFRELNGQLFNE